MLNRKKQLLLIIFSIAIAYIAILGNIINNNILNIIIK